MRTVRGYEGGSVPAARGQIRDRNKGHTRLDANSPVLRDALDDALDLSRDSLAIGENLREALKSGAGSVLAQNIPETY